MFKKAKKKQIEVEYLQFTDENKNRVYNTVKEVQMNIQHSWDENNKPCLLIPTLEGEMMCSLGDYLIKEPFPTDWRKIYPCKEEIFKQTYAEVGDNKNYLNTDLKIFRIDDGEEHFIVAEIKEDAIQLFMKELNFEELQECDLEVREIQKDEDIQINLNGDSDLLLELINRYKNIKDRKETINIWNLLKFNLIEDKLKKIESEIPYVISSSTFD
jgi:hypothetical protein